MREQVVSEITLVASVVWGTIEQDGWNVETPAREFPPIEAQAIDIE